MIAVWLNVDGNGIAEGLGEAAARIDSTEGEVIVDFAAVRRIDLDALRAMEGLVRAADEKRVKVVLSGVNVEVYKVLKLTKLARHFSFLNRETGQERS